LSENLRRVYGFNHTADSEEENEFMDKDPWLYRKLQACKVPLKKREIKNLRKE